MGNKYVYVLFDENEGDIGTFTSQEKAIQAAIDDGWCERWYDPDSDVNTPEDVFSDEHLMIVKVPLNKIYR